MALIEVRKITRNRNVVNPMTAKDVYLPFEIKSEFINIDEIATVRDWHNDKDLEGQFGSDVKVCAIYFKSTKKGSKESGRSEENSAMIKVLESAVEFAIRENGPKKEEYYLPAHLHSIWKRDLIVQSKEIKKLIFDRAEEIDVDLRSVCLREGLDYDRIIKHYLNKDYIVGTGLRPINQKEIITLCESIGIKIKIMAIKTNDIDSTKYHGLKLTKSNIKRWRMEFREKGN